MVKANIEFSTANVPQIHLTSMPPTYGIAVSNLVITVVPQNDICPQGKTYPKNDVALTIIKFKFLKFKFKKVYMIHSKFLDQYEYNYTRRIGMPH